MTTVAIVEDHPIFLQGLAHMIETAAESVEISGVYRSLEDFLAHAPARIDIVLLDLHLPCIGGAEGVRAVRERGHHVLHAQIAIRLYLSVCTVSSHLDRIRDKTGCRRRADLTRLALQAGLV